MIRPTDKVIMASQYLMRMAYDGESQLVRIENMNREGLFQTTIKPLTAKLPSEVSLGGMENPKIGDRRSVFPMWSRSSRATSSPISHLRRSTIPWLRRLSFIVNQPRTIHFWKPNRRRKARKPSRHSRIRISTKSSLPCPRQDKWKIRGPLDLLEKMLPIPEKQEEVNRTLRDLFKRSEHPIKMEYVRIWSIGGRKRSCRNFVGS